MKVLFDTHDEEGKATGRKEFEVSLVKQVRNMLWVRLPDGNVVKRKILRDLPRSLETVAS